MAWWAPDGNRSITVVTEGRPLRDPPVLTNYYTQNRVSPWVKYSKQHENFFLKLCLIKILFQDCGVEDILKSLIIP